METDKSRILYEQLEGLQELKVRLELHNGQHYCGVFTGFYHGTRHFVERWDFHEVDPFAPTPTIIQLLQLEGITIKHEEISYVFLFENQLHIYF